MSETRFTPGEWKAVDLREDHYRVVSEAVGVVAKIQHAGIKPSERVPNARLIAAAPNLYRELKAVEWAGCDDDGEGEAYAACPSCGGRKVDGHNDGCTLAVALAKAE